MKIHLRNILFLLNKKINLVECVLSLSLSFIQYKASKMINKKQQQEKMMMMKKKKFDYYLVFENENDDDDDDDDTKIVY